MVDFTLQKEWSLALKAKSDANEPLLFSAYLSMAGNCPLSPSGRVQSTAVWSVRGQRSSAFSGCWYCLQS